jgi:hypothetical protein
MKRSDTFGCIVVMGIFGDVGPTAAVTLLVGTASNSAPSTDPLTPSCHPNQDRCVVANPNAPWQS